MRSRAGLSGVWRSTSASKVRLTSSTIAQSAPPRAGAMALMSIARGRPESWPLPRLVARRREGSIVQTSTRRPVERRAQRERRGRRRLADAARAAGDQHAPLRERGSRVPRRGSGGAPSGGLELARERAQLVEPERLAEQERQRDERRVERAREPVAVEAGELAPADLAAGRAQRPACSGTSPARRRRAASLRARRSTSASSASLKRRSWQPFSTTACGSISTSASRRAVELDRLDDGHLLGRRHDHERRALGIAQQLEDAARVVADGPDRDRARGGERHLEVGEAMARGRCVDHDQVVERLAREPLRGPPRAP